MKTLIESHTSICTLMTMQNDLSIIKIIYNEDKIILSLGFLSCIMKQCHYQKLKDLDDNAYVGLNHFIFALNKW